MVPVAAILYDVHGGAWVYVNGVRSRSIDASGSS